jgi:hypothetical protein
VAFVGVLTGAVAFDFAVQGVLAHVCGVLGVLGDFEEFFRIEAVISEGLNIIYSDYDILFRLLF